jgi:hypothetical protein
MECVKSMKIEQYFDCTQRELVVDIAGVIYRMQGCVLPENDLLYLWKSQHPTEQAILSVAERIFAMFHGDEPDYSDDPPEIMAQAMEQVETMGNK